MTDIRDALSPASDCRRCVLADTRLRVVLPEGRPDGLLAVGEAPGRQEEANGIGFCGAAGRNLDRLLSGFGLAREDWARANTVWCRPPANRKPVRVEREACRDHLLAALDLLHPRVLLAVGETAALALVPELKRDQPSYLTAVLDLVVRAEAGRPTWPAFRGIAVVPMPHTSPLAWNRRTRDGMPIRALGERAAAQAIALLADDRAAEDRAQSE
jgi:uracil-DNA glycosylase family 4